jgi:hypothetical protein
LAEIPDHFIESLAESPYRAAAGIVDVALAEKIDFLLLAGNLVDPHRAGPRGIAFLHEQFSRLADRGIAVYWVTGKTDCRYDWPANIAWPSNVHLFSSHRVERFVHSRGSEPICQIAGRSADDTAALEAASNDKAHLEEFAGGSDDLFKIGVVPHPLDAVAVADLPVRYWALGGEAMMSTPLNLTNPHRVAHAAGSPQGRSPAETGPHSCTLVEVDADSQLRLIPMPADVVRWHHERIAVDTAADRGQLIRLLREQLETLVAAAPGRTLLVRWTLVGEGPLMMSARRDGLAAELTSLLRTDYGFRTPPAWSIAVEIEYPALPEAWYEQETLLGDYLRAVRGREHSPAEPIGLEAYISERQLAGPLAGCGAIIVPAARRSILRQAALLGADLLQPDAEIKEPSR